MGLKIIIVKALYGLKSSGAILHLKFSENLRNMGFPLCKVDHNLWVCDRGDHWEYVEVMVESLLVFSWDLDMIIYLLKETHKYKLYRVGFPKYYSRADVEYDTKRKWWKFPQILTSKQYARKWKYGFISNWKFMYPIWKQGITLICMNLNCWKNNKFHNIKC